MKKEVDLKLNLSDNQTVLLDNHSFFNLLNVLHLELQQLIKQSGDERLKGFEMVMLDLLHNLSEEKSKNKMMAFMGYMED